MAIPNGKEKTIKDLLARGCHLFPKHPGKKIPAILNWQNSGFNNYDDIKQSFKWHPDSNIGITCEPSNLVVIDCDINEKGNGYENFIELCNSLEVDVKTFTVQSAGGGFHFYFTNHKNLKIKTDQNKLGLNIETKAIGGCIMAPGQSIIKTDSHEAGTYVVVNDDPIQPLPEKLGAFILSCQENPKPIKKREGIRVIRPLKKNVNFIKSCFHYIDPECSRAEWRNIIWAAKDLTENHGWRKDWVLLMLIQWSNRSNEHSWGDAVAEFETLYDTAVRDITVGTLIYAAEEGKKNPWWLRRKK